MGKKILCGNCLDVLKTLPDESVHCCVTSPPYWGLRDYGTAQWKGGSPDCDHKKPGSNKVFGNPEFNKSKTSREQTDTLGYTSVCGKCGATRVDNQLGIEENPDQYVKNITSIFKEVFRVLRSDGTCWLNLGDTYNSNKKGNTEIYKNPKLSESSKHHKKLWNALKPKDLIGIPWRVAFALQGFALISIDEIANLCKSIDNRDMQSLDMIRSGLKLWEELSGMGWYWNRQDIIWGKSNPMPESATDRCTKSHEYIFLLTKSSKYWFDHEAIKEDAVKNNSSGQPRVFGAKEQEGTHRQDIGREFIDNGTRNKRSVWNIPTQPYAEAHFAVFPEKLIEPCILAGSPAKCCPVCGKGWKRVVEKERLPTRPELNTKVTGNPMIDGNRDPQRHCTISTTLDFQPDCNCCDCNSSSDKPIDSKPGVVIDPFSGSGTTGVVAITHGRDYIGIELNPKYIEMSERRIENVTPKTLFL
jgi:DNA modification methylase